MNYFKNIETLEQAKNIFNEGFEAANKIYNNVPITMIKIPPKEVEFNTTHTTKQGFGGLLIEGVKVKLLQTIVQERAVVKDSSGNVWHGSIKDLQQI